jgi:hypothetical protein
MGWKAAYPYSSKALIDSKDIDTDNENYHYESSI